MSSMKQIPLSLLILFIACGFAQETGVCGCIDWYGRCRKSSETWTDDDTWTYACDDTRGVSATFTGCKIQSSDHVISSGQNQTVDGFWYYCDASIYRLFYEQGCYYQNETKDWRLLRLGEKGYNGLVQHVCDRYKENPGRVQYIASIRTDIPHKSPTNKGKNQNLIELVDNRLKEEPVLWTHDNVALFIESKHNFNQKIRYLPGSWTQY